MMAPHVGLERRVLAALDATPPRIPVLLGGCGTGRTTALHALADRLGREACQYVDVERAASTPERFHAAISNVAPFSGPMTAEAPRNAREAFDRTLAYFTEARASDRPATFLLDEVLELRTFESFPGLRHVQRELLQTL
jgi:Cdc6-like AAA superfamily ATPase